ncbi:PAS domain S-box protein [uncultured Desulfobulbus sp.]|uniref:PAS domain-containing sensor histidine kinase n=1 Tax=uncultured Desulfobulbus sp. TaxID=239745 RepID=UPI0029C7E3EF|nr:PAS domain S-box protein [uncultured Desulfobulbus sp.]
MVRDEQGEQRELHKVQTDDQFRSFAETSPDLFVRLDREGRILYLSSASSTMLGSAPKAVLHRQYLDFIRPQDQAQVGKSFDLLLGGVHSLELILEVAHRNGGRVWVEIHAFPWFDGEKIVGVQSIVRDVSERKVQEDVLRHHNRVLNAQVREQHEELLQNSLLMQNLLNTTSAGIGILRQGRFQYLNGQLARMTGYQAAELLGRHWSTLFAPDAKESSQTADWPPLESGLLQSVESRWQRADGSLVDVLFSALPLAVGDHSRRHDASLTVLDMTTEKQGARKLRAAYSELEQIFNVAVPLCLLSLDCQILKINQAFCDFFHCSLKEALGKSGSDIWGCEGCGTMNCPVKQLQTGVGHCYQEIDKVAHGQHLSCTLHAAPYKDSSGQLSATVITFFDSRELKKISADLLTTRQQLIQAEKLSAIGSLAASIAHEFNNPLCGVRSVVERMARKSGWAAADLSLLELALENCDRMKRLIRDLQQFDKPFSDDRQDFDLHRGLDSLLLLLNKHLKVRKVVVRREYGNDALMVNASESQIKQALLNVIKNSGEALAETGGEIRIETSKEGNLVRIIVADSGTNISKEHLSHLFEPFSTTNKATVEGTGIGMSVASSIIKAHGGEILVESPPGQGTIFTVLLPAGAQGKQQGDLHVASSRFDCR